MHRPWDHAAEMRDLFHDGRITDNSLEERIREALQSAHDLEQVALARKMLITEPFQGNSIGPFLVLSPEEQWYLNELVPHFRGTPQPVVAKDSLGAMLRAALGEAAQRVKETLDFETLKEGGETSAENDSSTVLLGRFGNDKVLLTGDAGVQALERAIAYALSLGINLDDLRLLQVPHHGGRHNVSPSVLNQIKAEVAIAPASKDDPNHPRRVVTNALRRRGATVFATKGINLTHNHGMPARGWGNASPIPFFDEVEA